MNENNNSFFDKYNKEKLLIWFLIILIVIIFIVLLIPQGENKVEPTNQNSNQTTIKLYGPNPYYLIKGTPYEEPGYEAYDGYNNNISYKITKSGTVDYTTSGEYKIIYRVGTAEIVRTVIVSNIEPVFLDEAAEYTNEEYVIMLLVKGNDYLKTILPDGVETTYSGIEYAVKENGTYPFVIYDKYNNPLKVERKVEMIDKEGPTGSCTNKLDMGKTYVEVEAEDKLSGMSKYIYDNLEKTYTSTEAKYTYSGLYKDVNVTLVDKVGNKSTIKCVSSGEGALPQIKPPEGATITKTADSDTLKVSIEKKSGYYITRIWVLDPYNQINKGLILENWNKKRKYPPTILNSEITNKNLTDKIVIGINGSGFYENGTWTPNCKSSSYKEQYNRTTEGPLVIYDGKVIRNWYSDNAIDRSRNHSIYTISKEGNLDVYQNFNSLSEGERKNLFDSIIDKGYRNTWTFRPVAILNGNILTTSLVGTQEKKRNVFCQINRNNWVIYTGTLSASNAVNILKNLGCQTAVNMDGSDSVALYFKDKNGTLEKIYGGSRDIVDMLYITE